jgi:hypothetical protein
LLGSIPGETAHVHIMGAAIAIENSQPDESSRRLKKDENGFFIWEQGHSHRHILSLILGVEDKERETILKIMLSRLWGRGRPMVPCKRLIFRKRDDTTKKDGQRNQCVTVGYHAGDAAVLLSYICFGMPLNRRASGI